MAFTTSESPASNAPRAARPGASDAAPPRPVGTPSTRPSAPPSIAPLAATASSSARLRSRLVKEAVSLALPSSVLVMRGKARKKRVALTFDDGPDEMSPAYLDLLDRLGVRATFFVVGENVARARETMLDMVKRGHEVAGHGYTHRPFPGLGVAELVDELTHTSDLLPASATARPLVRPPTGATTLGSLLRVAAAGYTTALWSLDSDDCRTSDPKEVADRLVPSKVRNGEVVLLHENQSWTLAALPPIVGRLREAGFELVTMSEVLGW